MLSTRQGEIIRGRSTDRLYSGGVDHSLSHDDLHTGLLENLKASLFEVVWQRFCGQKFVPRVDKSYLLPGFDYLDFASHLDSDSSYVGRSA
jgi:hypothetical protein